MKIKACKDCKYYIDWCYHPSIFERHKFMEYIQGEYKSYTSSQPCNIMRQDEKGLKPVCGPEGKLFEQKEIKQSIWDKLKKLWK